MNTPYDNTKALIRIANVEFYCHNCNAARGIWKRIDENREVLQLIQENAPEVLEKYPCIEGWLGEQDIFLVNLRTLLEMPEKPIHMGPNFPRPWPGDVAIQGAYLTSSLLESSIENAAENISVVTPAPKPTASGFLARLTRFFQSGILALALLLPLPAHADILDAPCTKYGVPKALVVAIARQESLGQPWAVNIAGQSYFPASKGDALELIERKGRGKSFDVGIMQVNSQWLRKLKISPAIALEPANNIYIGVWILAHEIQRHGLNWRAVGAYHSPTPDRQRRYARSVSRHYSQIVKEIR